MSNPFMPPGLPSMVGSARAAQPPSQEQLAATVGEEGNSAFWNILRFIGRPGFAFRSLLKGDGEGAARNLAQFAVDLPTGGFVNKNLNLLSLANVLLPEKYELPEELTTQAQRPEFTDVLHHHGVTNKHSLGWGSRLGLDIVGGMATDPTTLISGAPGGVAKAGALSTDDLAKAAAKTAKRALDPMALPSRIGGMGAAPRGVQLTLNTGDNLVSAFTSSKWTKDLLEEEFKNVKAQVEATRAAKIAMGRSGKAHVPADTILQRIAANNIFRKHHVPGAEIDDTLLAMEKMNLIPTKTGMYLKVPFGPYLSNSPIIDKAWRKIGLHGTVPGLALKGLRKHRPERAAILEGGVKSLFDKVRSGLHARTAFSQSHLMEGEKGLAIRREMERITVLEEADSVRHANEIKGAWEGIGEAFLEKGGPAAQARAFEEIGELATKQSDLYVNLRSLDGGLEQIASPFGGSLDGFGPLQKGAEAIRAARQAGDLVGEADAIFKFKGQKELLESLQEGKKISKKAWNKLMTTNPTDDLSWLDHVSGMGKWQKPGNKGMSMGEILSKLREERQRLPFILDPQAKKAALKEIADLTRDFGTMKQSYFKWHGWDNGIRKLTGPMLREVRAHKTAKVLERELGLPYQQAKSMAERSWELQDEAFDRMAQDLVDVGLWKHKDFVNPLHLPQQTTELFYRLMEGGFIDRGFAQHYFKGKKHATAKEFQDALVDLAAKNKVTVAPDAVLKTNVAELWGKHSAAHVRTMAYQRARRMLEQHGMPIKSHDAVARNQAAQHPLTLYLQHQFKAMPERTWTKALGGGDIGFNINSIKSQEFRNHLKTWVDKYNPEESLFRRGIDSNGNVTIKWAGLNSVFKPLMTLVAPGFHIRNNVGTMIMGLTDPMLGFRGKGVQHALIGGLEGLEHAAAGAARGLGFNVGTVAQAGMDGYFVKKAAEFGWAVDDMSAFMRATSGDLKLHLRGVAKLQQTNPKFGKYTWEQAMEAVQASVGTGLRTQGRNQADLMVEMGRNVDVFGKELVEQGPGFARVFKRVVKNLREVADFTERRVRTNAVLELLSKGVPPAEAVARVRKAFVGYNVNSTVERGIRDVIPFAKFAMHSLTWGENIANRPAMVSWMARARGGIGEGEFLPERAEDSLALPLWWKDKEGNQAFLLGLGLPLETTLNMLGIAGNPRSFRRQVLAGIHPAVRTPMEHSVNRSFYFGDDFGVFRAPPSWMPKALTRQTTLPDGTVRYEIPGEVNELLRALPTSRIDSMVDTLLKERRPKWDRLLNLVTGARTMTVNQERELKLKLQKYLQDKAKSGQVGEALIYFNKMEEGQVPEDLKIVLAGLKGVRDKQRQEKKEKIGKLRGISR